MEVDFIERSTGKAVEAIPFQFIRNVMKELPREKRTVLDHLMTEWAHQCYVRRKFGKDTLLGLLN